MGWSSANAYFDVVVQELEIANVPEEAQFSILKSLAAELRAGDWDTLDESLEAFPDNPAVRRVMAEYDIRLPCTCKCCEHGDY